MAEPIKLLFGEQISVGPKSCVLVYEMWDIVRAPVC